MRVTVCQNMRTGTRHGMRYYQGGRRFDLQRYACGLADGGGGMDILIGNYTDWRDRVTCKTCLRVLARMEEAEDAG